jgi:hypothetical protein
VCRLGEGIRLTAHLRQMLAAHQHPPQHLGTVLTDTL